MKNIKLSGFAGSGVARKIILPLILFFGIFGLAKSSWAACTNLGNGSWQTADNTSAAVNECVTAALAGDTINAIAGDGGADYGANAVTISTAKQPLNIIGPGSNNLTINLTGNNAFYVEAYGGSVSSPGTRISGFKFLSPLDAKRIAIVIKGQGWRIDHCTYQSIESSDSTIAGVFINATALNTNYQPFGLIDSNVVINGKIDISGANNWANMCTAWRDNLNLGSNEAIYIEDNNFSSDTLYRKLVCDNSQSGKSVFRYNTTSKSWLLIHGLQADNIRGGRKWEVYGNTFTEAGGGSRVAFQAKAGTGIAFNNDITSPTDPWLGGIDWYHERDVASANWPLAGPCDGDSGWDSNESLGWLCRDQVGADKDASVWNSPPQSYLPAPSQTKTPAYVWGIPDSGAFVPCTKVNDKAATIIKNRDYYEYSASFDGSSGVGCGTLAARPATCTTGVGYWATDQSISDLTGMVGAIPTTPISGTLYKCTAMDTWTEYYTPYTYPHPLRNETFSDTTPPAAPGGLAVN